MTEALESFAINVGIAKLYELAGAMGEAERAGPLPGLVAARRRSMLTMARLIAPMAPHLAEEIGHLLDPAAPLVADQGWPEADPALLTVDTVTVAVSGGRQAARDGRVAARNRGRSGVRGGGGGAERRAATGGQAAGQADLRAGPDRQFRGCGMIGRRFLVAAAAAAGLGGCGFRPLYGKFGATGGAVAPELASIYVTVMSERQGQLLRQALQQRLAGSDDSGGQAV